MSRLFWILLYTVVQKSISIDAFRGLTRYILTPISVSSKIQKYNRIYVPPTITHDEEPMDHGELEWDFIAEDIPFGLVDKNITANIGVNPQFETLYRRLFRMFICGLPKIYLGTNFGPDLDNPNQIVFLFI